MCRLWCKTWPQRKFMSSPTRTGCQRPKGQRGQRCVSWEQWWMKRRWWRRPPTSSKSKPVMSEVTHIGTLYYYFFVEIFEFMVAVIVTTYLSVVSLVFKGLALMPTCFWSCLGSMETVECCLWRWAPTETNLSEKWRMCSGLGTCSVWVNCPRCGCGMTTKVHF